VLDANKDFVLRVNQKSAALNNLNQKNGMNSATSYINYQGLGIDPTGNGSLRKAFY